MNTIKVPGIKGLVPISQIMYILDRRNYSMVYTNDGKHILTSVTLKCFEEQTTDLVRIHKGTLINPNFVEKVALVESVRQRRLAPVTMQDGKNLAVARRRNDVLLSVKRVGVYS